MKQVLILALGCSVYRKNPRVRLEIDNTFVDEFELPHTVNTQEMQKVLLSNDSAMLLKPETYPLMKQKTEFFLKNSYSKVYEVENKNTLDIKINWLNDDNNYTNGFMTKSTFVYPVFFTIVPLKFFENIDSFTERYRYTKRCYKTPQNIKEYYKTTTANFIGKKTVVQNVFAEKGIIQPYGEKIDLSFKMYKKHGFWSIYKNVGGIRHLGDHRYIKFFHDKYYKNEDTRSSDT